MRRRNCARIVQVVILFLPTLLEERAQVAPEVKRRGGEVVTTMAQILYGSHSDCRFDHGHNILSNVGKRFFNFPTFIVRYIQTNLKVDRFNHNSE